MWLALGGKGPLQIVTSSQYYTDLRTTVPLTLDLTANYLQCRGGMCPRQSQRSICLHNNQVINYKYSVVSTTLPHFNLNRGRQHFVQCVYKYTYYKHHHLTQQTWSSKPWGVSRKGCTNNIVKREYSWRESLFWHRLLEHKNSGVVLCWGINQSNE